MNLFSYGSATPVKTHSTIIGSVSTGYTWLFSGKNLFLIQKLYDSIVPLHNNFFNKSKK